MTQTTIAMTALGEPRTLAEIGPMASAAVLSNSIKLENE